MPGDDLTDAIETAAQKPKAVDVDGTKVEQHSLTDQIAADEYIRQQRASNGTTLPLRICKIRPGSAL